MSTLLVLLFYYFQCIQGANNTHYTGAVVEFSPTSGNVQANTDEFIKFIKQAQQQNADIIVFPEIGLNGYGLCTDDMLTEVPHHLAKIAPCDAEDDKYSSPLKKLSCAARENKIYLVVNVAEILPCEGEGCPANGRLRYNTNVVFDRAGVVIARYRKFNLFGEMGTNITSDPELTFFDTDFDVRFGTFICFDLMFEKPATQLTKQMGITDFVFSTAWFSELPFLTAVQAQQMWAYSQDVNFLGSGYNAPEVGSGGSGIYRGRDGPLIMTFPDNTTSKLLVADLAKRNLKTPLTTPTPQEVKFPPKPTMYLKRENLTAYQSVALEDLNNKPEVCHDDFCCQFKVNFTVSNSPYPFRYRALVFNGVRTFDGVATGGIQACAIVTCENDTVTSCGTRIYMPHTFHSIIISGTFSAKSANQMPSTLQDREELLPIPPSQFNYASHCDKEQCNITMSSIGDLNSLITFGIYGRNFARDGEPVTTDSGGSALTFTWLHSLLFFFIFTLL